jgi:hypothetical protein
MRRLAPTVLAGVLATVYVIVSPPSLDLAAHLLRAKLFSAEGFGIWNNWWYGGHHVVLYSVLFPAVSSAITPQLAAAIAATATAALFEPIAHRHFGPDAWLGSVWFGAATAVSLYTGRLTFAFGLLGAVATVFALQRRWNWAAVGLAVLTALASPVAALFAALAGGAAAIGAYLKRRSPADSLPGIAVAAAALIPVGLMAIAFPEGGTEPFAFSAFWAVPLVAVALTVVIPRRERAVLAGVALYALLCVVSFAIPSAVGGNSARLAELLAGPLAALVLWPARKTLLLAAAVPLLYLQLHAPVRDVTNAGGPGMTTAYYRPLLSFLGRQGGPPFRVEIPFTKFHWEAYVVAPRFPLARGWERQLDIKYNHLFYGGALTPATYDTWLHRLAVRFVAVSDAPLDYSAVAEKRLIARGLSYLTLVSQTRHWRVYAVADPSPLAQGAATVTEVAAASVGLVAERPGDALVRVHFTPYWAITEGSGCVAPDGEFTKLTLRRAGRVELGIRFSLGRVGARSARCTRR